MRGSGDPALRIANVSNTVKAGVFQNRGVNAAHNGYSSQPIFGGPVYFFRNILYRVPAGGAFKMGAAPAGILIYHNTLIGEQTAREPYSNAHFA